jgi:hypothetical protein
MDWRMDVTGEMPSLRATNRQARDLLSPAPRRINLAFLLLTNGRTILFFKPNFPLDTKANKW